MTRWSVSFAPVSTRLAGLQTESSTAGPGRAAGAGAGGSAGRGSALRRRRWHAGHDLVALVGDRPLLVHAADEQLLDAQVPAAARRSGWAAASAWQHGSCDRRLHSRQVLQCKLLLSPSGSAAPLQQHVLPGIRAAQPRRGSCPAAAGWLGCKGGGAHSRLKTASMLMRMSSAISSAVPMFTLPTAAVSAAGCMHSAAQHARSCCPFVNVNHMDRSSPSVLSPGVSRAARGGCSVPSKCGG